MDKEFIQKYDIRYKMFKAQEDLSNEREEFKYKHEHERWWWELWRKQETEWNLKSVQFKNIENEINN